MRQVTRTLSRLLYYTGVIGLTDRLHPRRNVVILCAHEGNTFPLYVNYLRKNCNIISLDDYMEIRRNNANIPENTVAITFDDGYMDNYTTAYPILKEYKIPATIFLTVNMIGTENVFCSSKIRFAVMHTKKQFVRMGDKRWELTTPGKRELVIQELGKLLKEMPEQTKHIKTDEVVASLEVDVDEKKLPRMLTWEQVKEMSDNGITFGAHSLNHPVLTKISIEDARKEIADSKRILEEKIQKPVKYFAYPYGTESDYNKCIQDIVRVSGYSCAFTFIPGYSGHNSDVFTTGRMAIYTKKPELAYMLSSLRWMLFGRVKNP